MGKLGGFLKIERHGVPQRDPAERAQDYREFLLPRPVQEPHPPLYLACTKHDTLKLAAEYGIGGLTLGFAGVDDIAEMRAVYDQARAERTGERFVSSVVNDHFSALCPAIVLDDRERAARIGTRGQRFFAEAITHWYGGGPQPSEDNEAGDDLAAMAQDAERIVAMLHEAKIPVTPSTTGIFNAEHAYGNADDAIAYVERLREVGVDEVMFLHQMGMVPQDVCLETIRQIGEHVIPHFRALEASEVAPAAVS